MSKYFSKSFNSHFGNSINVKDDFSDYAKKGCWKIVTDVDASSFALKTLANLKTEFDQLDIDKLLPVLVYLHKLSDVVKNDVVKKNCVS